MRFTGQPTPPGAPTLRHVVVQFESVKRPPSEAPT
jgi:hypothetical protein